MTVVYCIYHKDEQLNEISDYLTPLNVNNCEYGYLNKYLGEFVGMIEIWKNKINHPNYIGFCHYRRLFKKEDIEENDGLISMKLRKGDLKNRLSSIGCFFVYEHLYKYLESIGKLKLIYSNHFIGHECFICEWNKFSNAMNIVYNWLNRFMKDFNIKTAEDFESFITNKWMNVETTMPNIFDSNNWFGEKKDIHNLSVNERYRRVIAICIEFFMGTVLYKTSLIKNLDYNVID